MSTAAPSGAEVLGLALEPEGEADDPTRERILDAALGLAAASGLERVRMDAVADRARVGRMTLYRRFGGKEELLRALSVREARRGLAAIAAAVDPADAVAERIADGFVATLRVARSHPLLDRTLRFEPERLLRSLNDPADPLLGMLRDFGAAQIKAGSDRRELRAEPEIVAELLVRIGLSFLLVPRGAVDIDDEARARSLARDLLAPLVSRKRS